MSNLLRRSFRQVVSYNFILLWLLACSLTVFAIPVQAQHQNATISRQVSPVYLDTVHSYHYVGEPRINTLANLEALINIAANLLELTGVGCGLLLICRAIFFGKSKFTIPLLKWKLKRSGQFCVGLSLIILGLLIPAAFNWSIASVRDATVSFLY